MRSPQAFARAPWSRIGKWDGAQAHRISTRPGGEAHVVLARIRRPGPPRLYPIMPPTATGVSAILHGTPVPQQPSRKRPVNAAGDGRTRGHFDRASTTICARVRPLTRIRVDGTRMVDGTTRAGRWRWWICQTAPDGVRTGRIVRCEPVRLCAPVGRRGCRGSSTAGCTGHDHHATDRPWRRWRAPERQHECVQQHAHILLQQDNAGQPRRIVIVVVVPPRCSIGRVRPRACQRFDWPALHVRNSR